jgi:hypothetical protein
MLSIFAGNKVIGTLQNSSHTADPSASFAVRHSETALDPAGPLVVWPSQRKFVFMESMRLCAWAGIARVMSKAKL